jgi:hypothetical protein
VDKLCAHFPQKVKSGGFEKLHFGQINSNFDAQLPQNIMPSGFSNWHFGHCILVPSINLRNSLNYKEGISVVLREIA